MDKHLNCFYSYNHDYELIENNLTRAFILTLKGMSKETRNIFLSNLHSIFYKYDLSHVNFALQNNRDINPKDFKNKIILTLSTSTFCLYEKEFKSFDKETIRNILISKICSSNAPNYIQNLCYGSIPDAWIYDNQNNHFCFLIECKKQDDQLNYPQLIRHAYENFGYYDVNEIEKSIIKLTWNNILEGLLNIVKNNECCNPEEEFILENFIDYLGFFGYSIFKGFNFNKLTAPPSFNFMFDHKIKLFNFNNLKLNPTINFEF